MLAEILRIPDVMQQMTRPWSVFTALFVLFFIADARAQEDTNAEPSTFAGSLNWIFPTRGAVTASPALSADGLTLYVGSADHRFYAINTEDGTEKWSLKLPGPIRASATLGDDGTIYVPCGNGAVYAISDNETEGVFVWPGPFRTHRAGVASPAIDDDGIIYVGSLDNRLYAVFPEDGGEMWAFAAKNDVGTPVIAVENTNETGTIYFSSGAKLFGVSVDGTEDSVFSGAGAIHSIPVIGEDGSIFFGANDERVYALKSGGTTNDVRWRFNTRKNVTSSPVIGVTGDIYIGSESARLYCLTTNGVLRWSVSTKRPVHAALSIGADGTIYAGSDDRQMYAISPDGKVRWTFKTRGSVRSAAAIDSQGTIYFGSNDKNVYSVFDDAASDSDENVWPMFRRDRHHTARATQGAPIIIQQPLGTNVPDSFLAEFVTNGMTKVIVTSGVSTLTATNGDNVLVSVIARAGAAFSYQWQFNGKDLDSATNRSATNATLILTNVQFANAGAYTVVVANDFDEVTSDAFTLQVSSAPVFTRNLTNQFLLAGGTLSLDLGVTGSEPLSFQWKFNGEPIADQVNATLTITNVQPTNSGVYTLMVMNAVGTSSASVTVSIFTNTVTLAQRKLAAGQRHSLALLEDNTLWAWGLDNSGQLGDARSGSTGSSGAIQPFSNRPELIGTNGAGSTNAVWASIAAGSRGYDIATNQPGGFSLGIQTNGSLWAWGLNDHGQLGLGVTPAPPVTPTRVGTDTNWSQVEAGATHSVGLKTDGSLWAWGANESGQLGIGTTNGNAIPVRVGLESAWVEVRAGGFFSLARRADGSIWGWGTNNFGQLGLGTNTTRVLSPTRIGTDTNWTSLSAGVGHSLALKSDGTLWAWGRGDFGQLGVGGTTNATTPIRVGTDSDWIFAEAGSFHSFGIRADHALFAWGANWFGQLGNGDSGSSGNTNAANKFVPVPIATNTTWRAVDASTHSLGLDTAGNIWAWGWNSHGQVGDGTTNNATTPVMLVFTNGVSTSTTNAPPVISIQPTNQFAFIGATPSFFANVTGGSPLSYQWYFNSNAISIALNSTATNATLSITNAQGANAGFYHAIITNAFGGITSAVASLTLTNTNGIVFLPNGTSTTNGSQPVITQQPSNQVSFTNGTVSFSVMATGSATLVYQWFFNLNPITNTTNLISTNATLVITNVQTSDDGFYSVTVMNNLGSVTSVQARLLVMTNENGTAVASAKSATSASELRLSFGNVTATGVVARVSGAQAGESYVLEFKDSLAEPNWTPFKTNIGPFTTIVDPTLPPRRSRFYRVRVE